MSKKIQFDPELVKLLKIIYGDADLSDRTLQQLYNTWKTNPDIIRNTAKQKQLQSGVEQTNMAPGNTKPQTEDLVGVPIYEEPKYDDIIWDNVSGISNFKSAFREARKRGLKQFIWKKTRENPSGIFTTDLKKTPRQESINNNLRPRPVIEVGEAVPTDTPMVEYNGNRATVSINKYNPDTGEFGAVSETYIKPPTVNMYGTSLTEEQIKNGRGWERVAPAVVRKQGGNLNNMNQQEILKKAFINYLVQVTGAKTEQDLAKLGQDQIKQLYQQFTAGIQNGSIEVSQDGNVNVKGRKAALGAKLSYFNKLQGKCPEGEQLVTFKIGGRVCTACQKGNKVEKKQTTNQNTNQPSKKLDPEKTPVLPGGKYPVYWTADDRIKWERKYGQKDEGAAVSPPPRKNQLGAALQLLLNKNR